MIHLDTSGRIARIAIGTGKVAAGLVLGTAAVVGGDILLHIPYALAAGCTAVDITKLAIGAKVVGFLVIASTLAMPALACLIGGSRDLGLTRAVQAAIAGANRRGESIG